jgi:hypothetical protein
VVLVIGWGHRNDYVIVAFPDQQQMKFVQRLRIQRRGVPRAAPQFGASQIGENYRSASLLPRHCLHPCVSQVELENMLKSLHRLDRRSFWMWVGPLLAAHWLLSLAAAKGMPFGGIDIVVIILLASALAGRFRDIGWPIWMGSSFLIVTMVVLPLMAVAYAFASHPQPAELLRWLTRIGQITLPFNLLLLVVAGCMPSRRGAAEHA